VRTDSEIIRDSRARPREFGELFDRHAASVHRYAASRVGESIADDVMSETFLVAFEKRAAFDHSRESANPWLLGIATNLLHRHHRAEARLLRATERAAFRLETGTVVDPDELRDVAAALATMPAADRDALLLFAWADLSYDDIAAAMRVPVGTVRSRLNRARRTLRAKTGLTEAGLTETDTTDTKEASNGRPDIAARNS
jgi:RNA polymerase sigma-70 factor (ECF subfamily)